MRESQKYALEEELREKVLARIVIIQRWVRAKLLRCRFLHVRRSAIVLQVTFCSCMLPLIHSLLIIYNNFRSTSSTYMHVYTIM